jgi:hypothetical protein
VRRGDVEAELLHEPRQARRLTLGQVHDETGKRGGVDDRMLERALQATTDEPRVEGVVAVLYENRALRKPQKCAARVPELRRADEHRALDVVTPARIRVDGGAAVDERVEERQRAGEREPFGPDLQHEEWGVACRLHIQRHELGVFESRARTHLGRVHRDLLPRHRLDGATWFEEYRLGGHETNASAPGPTPSGRMRSRPR